MQAEGRLEESLEPLQRLLEEEGGREDPEILYRYGRALSLTGKPTLGIWALKKAGQSPDWAEPAALEIATNALKSGDFTMAIASATEIIEKNPESLPGYELRAMARIQARNDYDLSLADADRALELDLESATGLVARAVSLLGLERIEEAAVAIELASEHFDAMDESLGPDAGRYCAVRGKFALEKQETERAGEIFMECLERFPSHELLVGETVNFLDGKGDLEAANEVVLAALEDNPLNRRLRLGLARRYEVMGRLEDSQRILEEATEIDQPSFAARALWDLAAFHIAQSQVDEGLALFDQAIEMRGKRDPDLVFAYGDALAVAGRFDDALALAEEMTVEPHRQMVIGRAYYEQGDYRNALDHFSQGLRLWPDNTVVRFLAADAAEQVGEINLAIEGYRYAMRAGAGGSDARIRLARLYAARGQLSEALGVLRHDFQGTPPSFEEALFELELMERLGQTTGLVPPHFSMYSRSPEFNTRASLIFIEGERQRNGSAAAVEMIEQSPIRGELAEPQNIPILQALLLNLADIGREQEALAEVRSALRSSPDLASLHGLHGMLLERIGEPEQAAAALLRAQQIDPDEAISLEARARSEWAEGRMDRALALYERLATLEPREASALYAAAQALSERGRTPEAAAYLRRALERDPYDGRAALALAQAELAQARAAEALVLARRAAQFGGGKEARDLVRRLATPKTTPQTMPQTGPPAATSPL